MVRKSLLFGFVFGFTLFSSFAPVGTVTPSNAQSYQHVSNTYALWQGMSAQERVIVDRLAADFYERSLRYAQTQAIETHTARLYAGATPTSRAGYRQDRRRQWQELNRQQQEALRNTKRPVFMHLSEQQKWPFREHALHQLGAAGAVNHHGSSVRPGI